MIQSPADFPEGTWVRPLGSRLVGVVVDSSQGQVAVARPSSNDAWPDKRHLPAVTVRWLRNGSIRPVPISELEVVRDD